jgi:hypothetical protein
MSTPVSDTPPRSHPAHHHRTKTPDLQAQMQHMIDLQYEQQHQISQEHQGGVGVGENVQLGAGTDKAGPSATMADSSGIGGPSNTDEEAPAYALPPAPNNTINNSNKNKNYWANYPDHGVGQGTLFFSSPSLGDTSKVFNMQNSLQSSPFFAPPSQRANGNRSNAPQSYSSLKETPQHMNLGSYGALESSGLSSLPPTPPPPPPTTMPQQQEQQQHQHQQEQHLLHQGEHEFHYGNPDYHDPFSNNTTTTDRDHVGSGDLYFPSPAAQPRGVVSKYCCCLWAPIVHAFWALIDAESLHRSFCYGAIDGMLTGSGIVATFCGIGLLSSHSSHSVRAMVVVFTTATCFADSVCMALGHVWTTHVLSSAQARERILARQQLFTSKADAKGQLVDVLLAKGMLKIDAMSLADTLEGYPDLFIGALLGDTLSGTESEAPPTLPDFVGGDSGHNNNNNNKRTKSYGRLSEYEMDPDAQAVNAAVREARREAVFMMLGFSMFAIVPSLIFWCAPVGTAVLSTSDATIVTTGQDGKALVSPVTVVVSVTAGIMWCLGVWKSRFLDCNWMLFGIETVVVMLICIMSAYSVGTLLNHLFLSSFEYALTSIPSMTSNEL